MPVSTSSLPTRAASFTQLKSQTFDLVVIGGGITGAGIARDAALRGFKTALLERQDFAGGTSSKSARLVHGGLRYIETLEFGVVYQACAERRRLQTIAPHLVTPLPFTLPIYHKRSRYAKVLLGMWIYDVLASYQNVRPHQRLTAQQLAQAEPAVSQRDWVGAVRYYERATDDARLTLSTILSAGHSGAVALNYAEVQGLLKFQGRVAGVGARDQLSGETFEVKSALVVNATGAWTDAVKSLDEAGLAPSVRPNKGIHVIVPRARLPLHGAVDFPAAGGKRTLYAVPWRHTCIIGTTDTDYAGDLDDVYAQKDEVEGILESANRAFTDAHLRAADVISTYAGLRPLVRSHTRAAYRATREHQISASPSGLISIAGGKLTTHRAMAKEVVDLASAHLQRATHCRTDRLPLDPDVASLQAISALVDSAHSAATDLDDEVIQHLVSAYGSQCWQVLQLANQDQSLKRRIVDDLPYLYAEVPYAAHSEMARTLNDVMIRRMHIIHEDKQQGLAHAAHIAALMGRYLGWDADEIARQVNAYRQQVALTRKFDDAWEPQGQGRAHPAVKA
ncbi:MAG TPA: glycerol-3-phosphate dehydrogenase/oxidase [Anaerolineales bacterium]|nr:glycerol-3-phosphate dehydrogenase/oxidase [Anaerolineales bacterium]